MKTIWVAALTFFVARCMAAQSFQLTSADLADSAALARTMPRLAEEVMATYKERDRFRMLDNLFRLQVVAGRYDDAAKNLAEQRALRTFRPDATPQTRAINVQYDIYSKAKALQAADRRPFAQTFSQAFRETFAALDDRTAALVDRAFGVNRFPLDGALRRAIDEQKDKTTIAFADALALLRAYQVAESFRSFASLAASLVTEDDQRRYIIEKDIAVRTSGGATVCALVVRPRAAKARLPALLEFTIYADSIATFREARRSAPNGYAGVTGLTRGKGCSPDKPVPYLYDASDAASVIDWISRQPWSDGRVGMFGGSYSGFTAWAAAKRAPQALKAIMVGAPVAPGIDVPMEGNVFWNFIFPWPFYTTSGKTLDNVTYNDNARWRRLNRQWYVSGRAYRDLDMIDGTPNPVFDEWISHPTYDAYWQRMIPFGKEFAKVNIPVLQTAGYYYGGPGAAVYYFTQHHKYNPAAQHYLVIGPYDHIQGQRGTVDALGDTATNFGGYEIDPVARIDIVAELRYQWFDHVLKGKPKPSLLKDKVNYEVMGANVWKHAPTLRAMANTTQRFHLSAVRSGDAYLLGATKPSDGASIPYTVNLADRSDVDRNVPGGGVSDSAVDAVDAVEFISGPFRQSAELSGLFSGHLEFTTNKKDFDFFIGLFELTPNGKYVQLPPYWARASHVADLTNRRLLTPGKREQLDFRSVRLMSRRCEAGSRLVVVLAVIKNPGQQINYGTGKDVNDETIADAGKPLTIRLFASSFIDVPVRR